MQSPIACDWDEDGRLFVLELPEYNAYAATRPHGKGRVVVLEDTDGDGVMDKRTVFADGLNYPTGLICYNGGVYVGAAPELLYLKDTASKGKADVRQVVLSGFGTDKAGEGQLNSFRWTLDNRILISTGLDGGEIKGPDGKDPLAEEHERPARPEDEHLRADQRRGTARHVARRLRPRIRVRQLGPDPHPRLRCTAT